MTDPTPPPAPLRLRQGRRNGHTLYATGTGQEEDPFVGVALTPGLAARIVAATGRATISSWETVAADQGERGARSSGDLPIDDLRDRIAGVVAAAGGRYDGADSDTIADAVMGAVGPEIERARSRECTALCADVERDRDAMAAKLAAVRELHPEVVLYDVAGRGPHCLACGHDLHSAPDDGQHPDTGSRPCLSSPVGAVCGMCRDGDDGATYPCRTLRAIGDTQ